jgi:predicted transcriptional regulator
LLFSSKPKVESIESQYVPYHLGLPKSSTLTNVHEFFVYGTKKGEEDVPERVLQVFQSHRARLISASIYPGKEPSTEFVVDCVLDTSKIDCQLDDLLILVRKLKFVKRAEKLKMSGKIFSNYQFPLVATGTRRAVIFDAEGLLAIENSGIKQDPDVAKKIASILYEQGRTQGILVAKDLSNNDIPAEKQNEFKTEAAKSYLRACGWGIFGYNLDRDIFSVSVTEPPVSSLDGAMLAGGSYLTGLIAGLLESLTNAGVRLGVTHESYNKDKNILTLYYAKESLAIDSAPTRASESAEFQMDESGDTPALEGEITEDLNSEGIETTGMTGQTPVSGHLRDPRKAYGELGDLNIVCKILTVSKPGALKVTLMHSSKLTLSEAKDFIQKLINADLLEVKRVSGTDTIIYQTTSKGIDYLDVHERLSNILEQDFPDTRILRTVRK